MPTMRIKHRLRDISGLGRLAGWDLGFRQLDTGRQPIPAEVIAGGHMVLVSMRFNRGFHQLGKPPNGMLFFGVPVTGLRDW